MSNRPSADTLPGTSMIDAASKAAAIDVARRRMREKANSVRNAYSTQRNTTHQRATGVSGVTIIRDGKRAMSKRERGERIAAFALPRPARGERSDSRVSENAGEGYRSIDGPRPLREPLTPTLSPQVRGEGAQKNQPFKNSPAL